MPSKPGWLYHKPGCKCRPCSGKAKTLSLGAGEPGNLEGFNPPPEPKIDPKKVIRADHFNPKSKRQQEILVGPDTSVRGRVREWLKYRTLEPSLSNGEIAERLGIRVTTMNSYLTRAVKEGWLVFADPLERIEHEIIPQVVDNLAHFLKAKDKQVTIETAKGTIFKSYEQSKGMSQAPMTVLALKIEAIDPSQVKAITGHIVGRPKTIDLEVKEVKEGDPSNV